MTPTRNPGRFAGLLYVVASIPGAFALVYVPGKLIVHGNASATASNIAASETLFRLGIACNLISQVLFIWVALALYDLLKGVSQRRASVMLGLIVISIPIALLNELNAIAALILVRGADFLSIIEKPQRDALAMLFLNLHSRGFGIAEIFWGLWLVPLGLLVYRSGFLPRILGVLVIANCFTYGRQFCILARAPIPSRHLAVDDALQLWRIVFHVLAPNHGRRAQANFKYSRGDGS